MLGPADPEQWSRIQDEPGHPRIDIAVCPRYERSADEAGEEAVAQRLTSKEQVLDFARRCWDRADAAIAGVGDEELAGDVGNPWGMPLTGTFAMVILNEEFLHHGGQVHAYVRACGHTSPGDEPGCPARASLYRVSIEMAP